MPGPRCNICGEVIGAYEPLLLIDARGARETTRLALARVAPRSDAVFAHASCYPVTSHPVDT